MKLKELMQVKEATWTPNDESYPLKTTAFKKGKNLYVWNLPMSIERNQVYRVVRGEDGEFHLAIPIPPMWLMKLIKYARAHWNEVPGK